MNTITLILNVLDLHHILGDRSERVVDLEEENNKLRKEIEELKTQLTSTSQEAEELINECLQIEESINDQETSKLSEENINLRKQLEEALASHKFSSISKGKTFKNCLHTKLEDSRVV